MSDQAGLFEAVKHGDISLTIAMLDAEPEWIAARKPPYGHTLLHVAAIAGHLPIVDELLRRGLDVNVREQGDDTYAMHWAAAAGHVDIVQRLADAGGDVVGEGDDHALDVIGWATCWADIDERHHAVADFLISRGAQHHIYSAIALGLDAEIRRMAAEDPGALLRRQSHNEDHRLPLHFAVAKNRPAMVALLLEVGADPLATDDAGYAPFVLATTPDCDVALATAMRARRGFWALFDALVLGEWSEAERLLRERDGSDGILHLMAKRNAIGAVKWLLDHGVDPNVRWPHWDADVTPLHLAAIHGHVNVVRELAGRGADPSIRDTKHDGDAHGWAVQGGNRAVIACLDMWR